MKKIDFLIPAIILIFAGCSSIYSIKNFSSKEKFYENYNKTAKDKQVNIILNNDSSLSSIKESRISNDTLILIEQKHVLELKIIPFKEISGINDVFDQNSIHSFDILLKNGSQLNEKSIKYLPDSSIQITMTRDINTNRFIPLNLVKKIYYKNNWLGIVPGLLIAAPVSYILYAIVGSSNHFNSPFFDYGTALFFGVPLGTAIGGIIGYIMGYNYIYQFN